MFCSPSEECQKTNESFWRKYRRNFCYPRSGLTFSQHVVPLSSVCDRVECKEITLIFEQSEHYSWSCGFLTWLSLGTMILLVAGGLLIIIRCCLKFRQSRNIERKRNPLSPSHIVFFSTNDLNKENAKFNDESYIINEQY